VTAWPPAPGGEEVLRQPAPGDGAAIQRWMPTLGPIVRGALAVLRRFPLVLLAGAVAAVAAMRLADELGDAERNGQVLAAATLGIPLFVALALTAERRAWGLVTKVVVSLVAIGLLVWFAVAWRHWSDPVRAGRYVQLSGACHLLVAFLPYAGRVERNGFWQYNRSLFERAIVSALYTVVLYAGAAIALAALDKLFGVDVPGTGYLRLWFALGFVFNTWFFLGGVPRDFAALEASRDYPVGIKAFTQYVLLPIVAVYLVILTAYLVKVLATWNWPSGWIGWLVSSVAAVGIFSLLLVHPVARDAANRWVAAYARWFYIALLPAIVMLWLAIWQRVEQYGITERRYFLIVLSLWLAGIAVHALITRSRSIRVIPASLCVVALLTLFGPWGAYRVSEASQVRRLAGLLQRNGLLAEGKARRAEGQVPEADRREISAVLRYLVETHGTGAIAPWFGDSLARIDTVAKGTGPSRDAEARAQAIAGWLNLGYVSRWEGPGPNLAFSYTADLEHVAIPVDGYEAVLYVTRSRRDTVTPGAGLWARPGRGGLDLAVYDGAGPLVTLPLDTLVLTLRAAGRSGSGPGRLPADLLRIERESPVGRAALYLYSITGRGSADSLTISSYAGTLLVGHR
jgi:hypothetical protein